VPSVVSRFAELAEQVEIDDVRRAEAGYDLRTPCSDSPLQSSSSVSLPSGVRQVSAVDLPWSRHRITVHLRRIARGRTTAYSRTERSRDLTAPSIFLAGFQSSDRCSAIPGSIQNLLRCPNKQNGCSEGSASIRSAIWRRQAHSIATSASTCGSTASVLSACSVVSNPAGSAERDGRTECGERSFTPSCLQTLRG